MISAVMVQITPVYGSTGTTNVELKFVIRSYNDNFFCTTLLQSDEFTFFNCLKKIKFINSINTVI